MLQTNPSAQAEEELENLSWLQRNAEALLEHGRNIAATGLDGEAFDWG